MNEPGSEDRESLPVAGNRPFQVVTIGIFAEASLVLVAWGLGWCLKQPVWRDLGGATVGQTLFSVVIGLLATLPMLLALVISRQLPHASLRRLSRVVDEQILPLFADASLGGLFLLAVAAGLGEELLFRALLQDELCKLIGGRFGWCWALLLISLLFGICHWVTPAYAVFATLVGIYLGALYWVSEDLLTAVVAHAAYDWVALVWLLRGERGKAPAER